MGQTPKPITIRGVTYQSQTAAAEALGLSKQAITDAIKRGKPDSAGTGPHKRGGGPAYFKPLTLGGVHYPSRKAAAKALGVEPTQISNYLRVRDAIVKKQKLSATLKPRPE